ncbi:MAG: hypothetical protein EOP52_14060 [Sphingobacteriales bacterium]|nr:MAG: hypothetical protein EOP52_14060 [Sphingobacteriales bacterium]
MRVKQKYIYRIYASGMVAFALIASALLISLFQAKSVSADAVSHCSSKSASLKGVCEYSYNNASTIDCESQYGTGRVPGGVDECKEAIVAGKKDATAAQNPQSSTYTPPAAGQQPGNGQPPGTQGPAAPQDDGTTCAVEMIGWILCPVIQGVATMSDKIFDLLAGNFLQIEPELTKADSGIKVPWDAARNIANVLFIVAFVIIIYSQITGAGISNYGIKKMLPRLIMAALFVNVSFWICQGMVDLSNILGFNIYTFLKAQAAAIGPSAMADIPGADTVTGGGWLSVLAVAILAAVGIAWLLLAPLGAIALMVLITCVTIVIILLLRKAIIILLVVISPIAFVAYLLPNTEKFFNKWLSMFWQLLMVFPVVALLMGGGQLASTIIMSAGATNDAKTQCSAEDAGKVTSIGAQSDGYNVACEGSIPVGPNGDRHVGWMLGLVAAGIAVAPLLAVWAVLKGALAAAGAIGGKIANSVQKGTAGAGNGAVNKFKNSGLGKYREQQKGLRNAAVAAGTYRGKGGKFNPRNARAKMNSALNKNSSFNRVTSGYGGNRALTAEALNRKDAKEAMDMFDHDDGLMSMWAQSGGDIDQYMKDQNMNEVDKDNFKKSAQGEKFKQMMTAGHNRKSSSFLAAADYLASNGKGSASDIKAAIKSASKQGASAPETAGALQSAIANSRKSGRADTLANLSARDQAAGPTSVERKQAFSDVGASSLSHGMFATQDEYRLGTASAEKVATRDAFRAHIADRGNWENTLKGYSQMDARTQAKVQGELVAAATTHGVAGGTVQEIKQNIGMQ